MSDFTSPVAIPVSEGSGYNPVIWGDVPPPAPRAPQVRVGETFLVCTDCWEVFHAMDHNLPEDRAAFIEAALGVLRDGHQLVAGDGGDEFSKSACECCGTRLHGMRFELTQLISS